MKNIANIAMIIVLIPVVFRIAFEKQLGPEQVAVIFIVIVFFIAGGKPIIKLFAGVSGLYLFAREVTGGIDEELVFALLIQVAIALIGAYIMFRSLFPRSWKKDKN